MAVSADPQPAQWYRSFYVRIGFSFVVFVVAVLVAQAVIFSYMMGRANRRVPGRSPNTLAAIVAADIGSVLAQDGSLDLQEYVAHGYSNNQPVFVVMKGGRMATNATRPLADDVRRSVEALLAGTNFSRGAEPRIDGPPVVTAPIQVNGELRGMVVLPPAIRSSVVRELGRVLSVPSTLLLIVTTTIATAFIFAPARRRLKALAGAAGRLGAGDLTARAPEDGGDEIAHVARSFNRMARDLAARDEALRAADRSRRQMLADVSHELKTPLTAMRGYLETLQMPDLDLDAATRERYFLTIERETVRLDRIVEDLLDLARLEHGVGTLNARLFAVERVFQHVMLRHEHETRTREIAVGVSVGDDADQVVADPDRIEQVVENLFANALRYTPAGGHIELQAKGEGDAIVLSVVDSGQGIAADHVPFVFDRFYKADPSRQRTAPGSGLGLSIAKAIVERHHGSIAVTSAPGRTAFTIVLPHQSAEPRHHSTSTNL